jgi:crotonobetainyl-CoA:carnitine CoA-transferase CaiB-like acyl-CoA transferase
MEDMEMVRAPWLIGGEVTPFTRAPLLGEHNDYVFKELLNLGDDRISELLEKEIIITPEEASKLNT